MDYIKANEYLQMKARKEWEEDALYEKTMVEETEEEFLVRAKRFEETLRRETNCSACPYHSTKKTKYGTYDWCKKHGCSTSSPKNPCGK